ncbi:hypothetical protein SADUNF_Sadunf01G0119700 [Salix dunnii]|uniref:F-box protein At3g26010-like beta-propeller domain-containing protein n=1 Tax=Salix dunnii TaxID=1413687 RepID=A0A835TMG1_9ROSI|nr:hypothetical protein SADUNF_Sadunf01G0119700 [Salix dunnii]
MEDQKTECSENSSNISDMGGAKGFVCHYRFQEGSSQFIFLDVDQETGGVSINNPLSFSASSYLQTIASANGLLLLSGFGENQLIYHVFNPLTMRPETLPPHGITGEVIRSGLAFDGKQYQVVLIHAFKDEENGLGPLPGDIELEIYSSETGSWRKRQPFHLSFKVEEPVSEFTELNTSPLFSNGAIHWEINGRLLVYHVKDDRCEVIELPDFPEDTMTFRRCLWEYEGRLRYTHTDFEGVHTWNLLKKYEHDVYLHSNVYDSEKFRWALVYTIFHKELAKQDLENCPGNQREPHYIYPFAYGKDSETIYLQLPGIVVAYNTKTRSFQKVCRYEFPGTEFNCCCFFPFIQSNERHQKNASESLQVGEVVDLPLKKEVNSVSF